MKKLCPQRGQSADSDDHAHTGAARSAFPQRYTTRGNDGGPGKEPIQPTSGSESGPVPVPAQEEGGSANDGGHEQDEHEFYADVPADERATTSVQQEQPAAAEPVGHSRKEMAVAEHFS